MKIKVGDKISVTKGKDSGRQGTVEKIFFKKGQVFVPGLNVYKKHRKAMGGQEGGIVDISRPYPISSVVLICPNCQKKTRVKYFLSKSGEKSRVCVKCGKQIVSGKGGAK